MTHGVYITDVVDIVDMLEYVNHLTRLERDTLATMLDMSDWDYTDEVDPRSTITSPAHRKLMSMGLLNVDVNGREVTSRGKMIYEFYNTEVWMSSKPHVDRVANGLYRIRQMYAEDRYLYLSGRQYLPYGQYDGECGLVWSRVVGRANLFISPESAIHEISKIGWGLQESDYSEELGCLHRTEQDRIRYRLGLLNKLSRMSESAQNVLMKVFDRMDMLVPDIRDVPDEIFSEGFLVYQDHDMGRHLQVTERGLQLFELLKVIRK